MKCDWCDCAIKANERIVQITPYQHEHQRCAAERQRMQSESYDRLKRSQEKWEER